MRNDRLFLDQRVFKRYIAEDRIWSSQGGIDWCLSKRKNFMRDIESRNRSANDDDPLYFEVSNQHSC